MSEEMPQDMPEDIRQERLSEDMPENVPEDMSEEMPKELPVWKGRTQKNKQLPGQLHFGIFRKLPEPIASALPLCIQH